MVAVTRLALGLLLLVPVVAAADDLNIDVVGLFKDTAVLVVNGKRELVRRGQRSPDGILLLKADSNKALVDVNGKKRELSLSGRISTRFKPFEGASVAIPLNDAGQYRSSGTVNDQPVSFLIDTGASVVAMNAREARRLGIDYQKDGRMQTATTASGLVKTWAVNLDSIQIGGIRVTNVPASVLAGDYPQHVLLGMTFLRNVEIKQSAGLMVLKSKY